MSVIELCKQVLVAEDHVTNQLIAASQLQALGCAVTLASNGREAVELFSLVRYDLVLMDCLMPEMDGYEATRRIRAAEARRGKRTPIVAMTASDVPMARETCLAAGMDDYLAKPIEAVALRSLLEKWWPVPKLDRIAATYGAAHRDSIIELYGRESNTEALQIREAVASRNRDAALRHAHGLKGLAASVFAESVVSSYEALRIALEEEDWAAVEAAATHLLAEHARSLG